MKKFLVAAALLGLAACVNTEKNAVGSAETANAPATCSGDCSSGGACCSEGAEAKACSEAATECDGGVCPVTGKKISN
ncbi:MAG: hypothetical protein R3F49_14580 [Planctomycetota bacterium]